MPSFSFVRRGLRTVRRRVLAHRRPLAAALLALSVLIGLRATQSPAPAMVPVPVASRDLATGDRLSLGDVVLQDWPADLAPPDVPRSLTGRVLAGPVRAGDPLTGLRLVGSDLARAHPDLTVLPVRLPDPAVVDLLDVGDRVDLGAVDPKSGAARELASDVLILAIPPPSPANSTLTGRLVVAGISPDRASDVTAAALTQFLTVAYAR